MLDGMTADKPKRKPAGAAVPGAVERPKNYPHTLVFLVSDETLAAFAGVLDPQVEVQPAHVVRDQVQQRRRGHDDAEHGDTRQQAQRAEARRSLHRIAPHH